MRIKLDDVHLTLNVTFTFMSLQYLVRSVYLKLSVNSASNCSLLSVDEQEVMRSMCLTVLL